MVDFKSIGILRGRRESCPQDLLVDTGDETLDDILFKKRKAIKFAPKDKMVKGTERKVRIKSNGGF